MKVGRVQFLEKISIVLLFLLPLPDGDCPGAKPNVMEGLDVEDEADVCLMELFNELSDFDKEKIKDMLTPLSFFRWIIGVTSKAYHNTNLLVLL